ncbi:MAG: YebC/PmpR family DNA-binding transcriptional regulator [Planctomycetota bacterium]|nr:MAG: YebC/PmpR family DNA-binding transcriptional regulator [Planctomycetota bacterium]REJ91331.1 MAG: YebC/PmpR family DNA-binding transcriptional regulator [Planctomycetota bacterium]REK26497.1 MAG: YebC/PmpR family DNA-binding transcriptional regulator [Planctomycetota bacterium]REK39391.1 MAG: YebC/PmpR family DNA-binding transcriptional regulator [Planctomycetota bacterium]
MAGHSHWAGIKHKKALIDNKRGKVWSKCSKAIIVAAKLGGGDPNQNPRLRLAVADAKAARMPKDTIERAIKKGTGELEGGNLEEIVYEGYGAGGVAVFCEILTDNRNRTAPEIRKIFEVCDGKLGGTGCVAWMFERKGLFLFAPEAVDEDTLVELALEHGADDVTREGDKLQLTCEVDVYGDVVEALEAADIEAEMKEVTRIPTNTVDLDAATGKKVLKLMERLDDHDDVQNVSANFNLPDEAMAEIDAG